MTAQKQPLLRCPGDAWLFQQLRHQSNMLQRGSLLLWQHNISIMACACQRYATVVQCYCKKASCVDAPSVPSMAECCSQGIKMCSKFRGCFTIFQVYVGMVGGWFYLHFASYSLPFCFTSYYCSCTLLCTVSALLFSFFLILFALQF